MSAPGRRFDRRAYLDPAPAPWLIHALGPVVHDFVLPHLLRLHRFELPGADLARLRAAVHPGTAAFLGPSHPEFMTDWMIDKELSRRVSPLMAHWAAYEIVNMNPLLQRFWLANNLIATAPGGGGKTYSIAWACRGHGVLLHPEGTVNWHTDAIGSLAGGIVEMAWDCCAALAARGESRPVLMVPIVWKLVFERDVADGLVREIDHVERALGLPRGAGDTVERRFASLQIALLVTRAAKLGLAVDGLGPTLAPRDYFAAQERVESAIRARLGERYASAHDRSAHGLHRLRRAIRARAESDPAPAPEARAARSPDARAEHALLKELTRLFGFPAALYDVPALAQEHVAENLKRTRALLLTHGAAETLHNLVPRAVAPRAAHLRVAEPIAVHEAWAAAAATGATPDSVRGRLLEEHRARLAGTLATLVSELAPVTRRFERPNPLGSHVS